MDETLGKTYRLISLQNLPYVQLFVGVSFIINNFTFSGSGNLSLRILLVLFDWLIFFAQKFGIFVIYRLSIFEVDFEPELLVDESLSLMSSFHILIHIADRNNEVGVKSVNNINQHAQKHS